MSRDGCVNNLTLRVDDRPHAAVSYFHARMWVSGGVKATARSAAVAFPDYQSPNVEVYNTLAYYGS